jgi:uncharacterized protein YodC (DUF2158 family)
MSKKSALFEIGDTVRLRSGGPSMVVVQLPGIDLPDLPGEVGCTWFEGKRLHRNSFPPQALEAAPSDQATGVNVSELLNVVKAIKAHEAKQAKRNAASKPKSR